LLVYYILYQLYFFDNYAGFIQFLNVPRSLSSGQGDGDPELIAHLHRNPKLRCEVVVIHKTP